MSRVMVLHRLAALVLGVVVLVHVVGDAQHAAALATIAEKERANAYTCGAIDATYDVMLGHPEMWPAAVRPAPLPHCVEVRRLAIEYLGGVIGRERRAGLGLRQAVAP